MKTQTPLYLLIFLFSTAVKSQYCYYADGVVADVTSDYLACPYRPVNTICCSIDRDLASGSETTNASLVRDVCLDNGLCMNNHTINNQPQVSFYINGCTNEDPKAPECFNLCERKEADASSSLRVTPCSGSYDSEKWCCGDTDKCCSDGTAITVPAVFGSNLSNNKTSSETISSSSSAPPNSSSQPPNPNSQQDQQQQPASKGLSTGTKAGIAASAVGGTLVLIGALFFVFKALAWKKKSKEAPSSNPYSPSSPNPFMDQTYHHQQQQPMLEQQWRGGRGATTPELDSATTTPHLASAVPALGGGSIKYAHETGVPGELPAVAEPVEVQGRADPVELPAEGRVR